MRVEKKTSVTSKWTLPKAASNLPEVSVERTQGEPDVRLELQLRAQGADTGMVTYTFFAPVGQFLSWARLLSDIANEAAKEVP